VWPLSGCGGGDVTRGEERGILKKIQWDTEGESWGVGTPPYKVLQQKQMLTQALPVFYVHIVLQLVTKRPKRENTCSTIPYAAEFMSAKYAQLRTILAIHTTLYSHIFPNLNKTAQL
jgi:hypothetical protein